jgi:thiol-disulfide isomerase/thioredoxin
MKKLFPLLLLAVILANAAAQSGRKATRSPAQPDPPIQAPVWSQPEIERPVARIEALPELTVLPERVLERPIKSLDNGSFRLADFDGKVVVVNMWASWCGPCRSEVPEYEKVRKAYAGREVEFIGLTPEDPRTSTGRVQQFVRNVNFGFRLGWADRETAYTLMNGQSILPQTMVIAASGRIVSKWHGYSRSQSGDRLRDVIKRALDEAAPPVSKQQ